MPPCANRNRAATIRRVASSGVYTLHRTARTSRDGLYASTRHAPAAIEKPDHRAHERNIQERIEPQMGNHHRPARSNRPGSRSVAIRKFERDAELGGERTDERRISKNRLVGPRRIESLDEKLLCGR